MSVLRTGKKITDEEAAFEVERILESSRRQNKFLTEGEAVPLIKDESGFLKDIAVKDWNKEYLPLNKIAGEVSEDVLVNGLTPRKIIDDLFEGINSDIKENVKLNSKKELLIYSYRVAGTVGLMMAKILNVHKEQSLKSAIDLGIAMQLTNISRDVMEDKKNNRFYINESFEDIKTTIKLSEKFYENSFYSIKEIPLSFRFSILVARRVYRKIGYKILNKQNIENYKKSGKIYVSNIEKIIETFLSIFDLIKLSLISKNDDNINHDHNLINEEINLNERI